MASTYRLFREAHVVVPAGKPLILTMPEGSIITVHQPAADSGLIPVQWGSRTVKMFAEDLECRAELVSEAAK